MWSYRKRDRYGEDVIRPEAVLLILAPVTAGFLGAFVYAFWPGATFTDPDWVLGIYIGVLMMFGVLGLAAAVVLGRYHAPKFGVGHKQFELTRPSVLPLEAPAYSAPPGAALSDPNVPDEDREMMQKKIAALRPGMNERGELVPWGAMRLGGWRIGQGDRWDTEGKDGFLLLVGEGQVITCYENRYTDRDVVLIRHESVAKSVLEQLKKATERDTYPFIPYSNTPLYRTTDILPQWAEHYRRSPAIREIVLDDLGIPGLCREFIGHLHAQGLEVSVDGPAQWKEVATLLKPFLEARGAYTQLLEKGHITPAYAMGLYHAAEKKITALQLELDILEGTVNENRLRDAQEAHRNRAVYEGSYRPYEPPTTELQGSMEQMQGFGRQRGGAR